MEKMTETEISLHRSFKQLGFSRREATNKLLSLLPEIDKAQIWKKAGFNSIFEYALKIAGLSTRLVKKALIIDSKLEKMPELKALIETQGLSKLEIISSIAKEETVNFWVDKAQNMSRDALQKIAREEKAYQKTTGEPLMGTEKSVKVVEVQKMLTDLGMNTLKIDLSEKAQKAFFALKSDYPNLSNRDALEMMLASLVSAKSSRNSGSAFAKASKIVSNNTPQKKVTRHIPKHISKTLEKTCTYPSCNKPAEIIHHPKRFSERPNHENLRSLCKAHHEFMHNAIIKNEQQTAESWAFNGEMRQADYFFGKYRQLS